MTNHFNLFVAMVAVAFAGGCHHDGAAPATETGGIDDSATAADQQEGEGQEQAEAHEHGEGEEHEEGNPGDIARAEPPITEAVSVGEESSEVESVDAADIIADPSSFEGRTVQVSGSVNGFCVHERGWFAIEVPGASPAYLRVLARPAFRVPEGVFGATAVAQGTVEFQELPLGRVMHFEQTHRLGATPRDESAETVRMVVIRGQGATFTPRAAE